MTEPIVISGWGQVTQPKNAAPPFLEPIDMMERAALAAGALAGVGVLQSVDTFLVVRTQSRTLANPGDELARRLGARPRRVHVSGIGGEVPQQFVNRAAGMLARGEAETILICGAETEGVEPDARNHECESCGAEQVFGAAELLLHLA